MQAQKAVFFRQKVQVNADMHLVYCDNPAITFFQDTPSSLIELPLFLQNQKQLRQLRQLYYILHMIH